MTSGSLYIPAYPAARAAGAAACAALAVLLGIGALPVAAQVSRATEPAQPQLVPPLPLHPDVSAPDERQLDQFAQACIAVAAIQSEASATLARTSDTQQAFEVKARAEGAIIEAVERSGLRLEEFNRIAEQMAYDRELRLRIAERLREHHDL